MAEQDTNQHTTGVKEGETLSTNMDPVSPSKECKVEDTDITLNIQHSDGNIFKKDSTSSSPSTKRDTENSEEGMEQGDIKNCDSSEEKMASLKEPSICSNEASLLTAEDNSPLTETDDGCHGDANRVTPRNEQLTAIGEDHTGDKKAPKPTTPPTVDDGESNGADTLIAKTNEDITGVHNADTEAGEEEDHTGEKNGSKTTSPPTPHDREDDQTDGPSARDDEEITGTDNTDSEAEEDDGSDLDVQESTTPPQTSLPHEEEINRWKNDIETIGPITQQTTEPALPVVSKSLGGGGITKYLITVCAVAVAAVLVQYLYYAESPPQKDDMQQIDIFLRQMDKLNTQFPNQRSELWIRSKIHLLRHLQTPQPTEPVSLILTAGVRAEQTLHCLAQGLASAFSSAHNASVLHIDGASKASQDSDQVKLDIDSKLQGAFEGDKPVAVIHRFEELPPGSTLIFYRYCDHENAAYKKTFLIFTVLLGEEEEIPVNSRLSTVEEMVDDHLQKKFLSHGHPISFDRMDLDKYGGLWSRISHLILPVTAEERMEHEGCSGT